MIVATGPLRSREVQSLLNRADVCAVVETPALDDLRHVRSTQELYFVMRAWFTGSSTWIVYYAH